MDKSALMKSVAVAVAVLIFSGTPSFGSMDVPCVDVPVQEISRIVVDIGGMVDHGSMSFTDEKSKILTLNDMKYCLYEETPDTALFIASGDRKISVFVVDTVDFTRNKALLDDILKRVQRGDSLKLYRNGSKFISVE